MLAENVFLPSLQVLVDLGADLAGIDSADLDPHKPGPIKSAPPLMRLGLPPSLVPLITARALLVVGRILDWIFFALRCQQFL